jgi:hypothetical protein
MEEDADNWNENANMGDDFDPPSGQQRVGGFRRMRRALDDLEARFVPATPPPSPPAHVDLGYRRRADENEKRRDNDSEESEGDDMDTEDQDIPSQAANVMATAMQDLTMHEDTDSSQSRVLMNTIQRLQTLQQEALRKEQEDRRNEENQPTFRWLNRRHFENNFRAKPIEFSEDFIRRFPKEEDRDLLARQFYPLYASKEAERAEELDYFRRHRKNLIWKTSPLHRKPVSAPYHQGNRISWVLHTFVPPGYENNPRAEAYGLNYDWTVAMVQFKADFLPLGERTLETRKRLLVEYINHFFCHIEGTDYGGMMNQWVVFFEQSDTKVQLSDNPSFLGAGKAYYIWRQYRPSEISRDTRSYQLVTLGSDKEVEKVLSTKITLRNPDEAEEAGNKAKGVTIGKFWLENMEHLRFYDEVFDPSLFHQKLYGAPEYNPECDRYLNTYQGWAVSPERAAKFHHRLYRLFVQKGTYTDEGSKTDVMPFAGWFCLEFVDRTNFTRLQQWFSKEKGIENAVKVGDLVTRYHALPKNPYARGTPWAKNPFWDTDHLALQQELRKYNFDYFYSVPPPGMENEVQPPDPDDDEETALLERQLQIVQLWFDNPNQPAQGCGVSVAPILHYIFHGLANGQEQIYTYIMNWLASWRQRPDSTANTTCLVLRSDPGTGKNSFVHALAAMVGSRAFYETSDASDLLGYFTGNFGERLLVHLDEFRVKDNEQMCKLKAIITGHQMRQRLMQTTAESIPKFFSTIISANMYMVLNADPGERRFVFLQLPRSLAGSKRYLTANCRVLFADGVWAWEGEKNYKDSTAGPGVLLLAHYLDNWHIDPRVSLLQIPQNMTLYEHQIHSLDSVAQWWFDKLKGGMHVDWAAVDDIRAANVAKARYLLQLSGLRQRFMETYQNAVWHNPVTSTNEMLFTNTWFSRHGKWDAIENEPHWGNIVQRLMRPFMAVSAAMRPFGGNENAGPLMMDFFIALGENLLNTVNSTISSKRKFFRGAYFWKLYVKEAGWLRVVWKEQLYGLYVSQASNRREGRGDVVESSKFFAKIAELSRCDSIECQVGEKRMQIQQAFLIPRDQTFGTTRNLLTFSNNNNNNNRSRNPLSTKRIYYQLDTLDRHRKAFFDKMHWEELMWDHVWDPNFKLPEPNPNEKPWGWFGDRIKQRV